MGELQVALERLDSYRQADAYYRQHDPDNVSREDLKILLLRVLERLELLDERLEAIEKGE